MIDTDNLTDRITEVLGDLDQYAYQCHGASLALVKSGILDDYTPKDRHPRVARGGCKGVPGQHSWAICGDVYDRAALIVDITLWSYDSTQPRVWVGTMAEDGLHTPFGNVSIWQSGTPYSGGGPELPLDLSHDPAAESFLDLLRGQVGAPLDRIFWMKMFSCNAMQGWPARPILEALLDAYPDSHGVPIDIIGHLTERNPGNLYW